MNIVKKHWQRLKRSWGRRFRELRLPRGYQRLGTRYGGWWIDASMLDRDSLLVDCGLGEDISFPAAFIEKIGGQVVGVEPNPRSLSYCQKHRPAKMRVLPKAIWKSADTELTFHLPRPQEELPDGADGVSGSIHGSHPYVIGGDTVTVATTTLPAILESADRQIGDVLKLDIEGAEYEVLDELCRTGDLRRVRQLLVEFHHGHTHHTFADTEATIAAVRTAGFDLIHVEGRNYVFRIAPAR